jgi:hypothetical protein
MIVLPYISLAEGVFIKIPKKCLVMLHFGDINQTKLLLLLFCLEIMTFLIIANN